jgi:apolipoprotein N-acyltransferase
VRATGDGLCVAFDAEGRQRASLNSFESRESLMVVDMLAGRRATLYARTGDVLPALCLAGLLACVTLWLARRARRAAGSF